MENRVRIGLIGAGVIGQAHLKYLPAMKGAELTAVAEANPAVRDQLAQAHQIQTFDDGQKLMESGLCDAVLIATPHRSHPTLAVAAFERGLHVLVEKPVAVTALDAQRVNEAHQRLKTPRVYAAMFVKRLHPTWHGLKRLMDQGRLGRIQRVNYTITTWFRNAAYYRAGGWRATWAGEGGGVLINQCPHNLDLLQWLAGMPNRVTAVAGFGKHHAIEVEDEVTAILEYPNGAVGTFATTTGEYPGVHRLEVVGDLGTAIVTAEDEPIQLMQLPGSLRQFSDQSPGFSQTPDVDRITIQPGGKYMGLEGVTHQFIDAVRIGSPLVTPGVEGIHSLELGNAMRMSAILGRPVEIPTPREQYHRMLQQLAEGKSMRDVRDSLAGA